MCLFEPVCTLGQMPFRLRSQVYAQLHEGRRVYIFAPKVSLSVSVSLKKLSVSVCLSVPLKKLSVSLKKLSVSVSLKKLSL